MDKFSRLWIKREVIEENKHFEAENVELKKQIEQLTKERDAEYSLRLRINIKLEAIIKEVEQLKIYKGVVEKFFREVKEFEQVRKEMEAENGTTD